MKRKIMDKQIDSKETETKPELYTVLVAGEYYKINILPIYYSVLNFRNTKNILLE